MRSVSASAHEAACLSEGLCPDHLVPSADYGQMFDLPPLRCARCDPDIVWHTLTFNGSRRVRCAASLLAWKPVRPPSA